MNVQVSDFFIPDNQICGGQLVHRHSELKLKIVQLNEISSIHRLMK